MTLYEGFQLFSLGLLIGGLVIMNRLLAQTRVALRRTEKSLVKINETLTLAGAPVTNNHVTTPTVTVNNGRAGAWAGTPDHSKDWGKP